MDGTRATTQRPATLGEIRRMVGDDAEAAKLESILATGATPPQIEEAMTWVAGASDVMGGDLQRPLSGPVAAVYQILASELPPLDERD
jgi:hypothetical protein